MKNISQLPIKHLKTEKYTISFLVGAVFSLLVQQTYAAEVNTKVVLTGGLEYNSNPAMSSYKKDSVWIFTLAPNILFDVKSDNNTWYVDGLLTVQRNSNEIVLIDREDPRLLAGWTHTYESGILGVTASYTENSSLMNQLISSGVFTQTNNTLTTKQLAANWKHEINDRWSALTEGAYYNNSYSTSNSLGLGDYSVGDIKSKLTYANNEKLNTHVQLGYAQLNPDANVDNVDKIQVMLGADYIVNDRFNFGVNAGVYNLSGRQSDTDWLGGISANYNVERMTYLLGLNRAIDTSGLGGFQKADSLKLGWTYARTEHNHFGADYSLNKYKKDNTIGLDNVDFQQLSAYYERNLSSSWQTRVSAAYRKIDSLANNSNGSLIGITFVYDNLSFNK